jgi:hypothetical protein
MSRGYRLAAIISLAALLSGAVPASAAPVGGWSLFAAFSPVNWIRTLWDADTVPWTRTGDGDPELAGAPHALWAEEGSTMDPLGRSAATASNGWTWIDPLAQQ